MEFYSGATIVLIMAEFGNLDEHDINELAESERPRDLEEFLRLQEQYIHEATEIREAQIWELTGAPPTENADQTEIERYKEGREAAEALLEDDYLKDPRRWEELRRRGLITVIPPGAEMIDKRLMVGLISDDPVTYDVFNSAAGEVTRPFGGQPQIGSGSSTGYAAWELFWTSKDRPAPKSYRLIEDVHKIMQEYHRPGPPKV